VFDEHSTDGTLAGYTPEAMDDEIGWPGFTQSMIDVGWAAFDGDKTLSIPEPEAHNGAGAKRRAMDSDRKKSGRLSATGPQNVLILSASDADVLRTREEKRREEDTDTGKAASPPPSDEGQIDKGLNGSTAGHGQDRRLTEVTNEAVIAYNAIMAKPKGRLPAVQLVNDVRRQNVKRCIPTARAICLRLYQSDTITPEFWTDYFAEADKDDFCAGRSRPGEGHENWKPDFEYLTRKEVMTKLFDKAMSEAAHG
jgi:hypothetical protein